MNIKKVLEQALKAMDFYDYTGTVEESETYIKAIVQCKQAIEWLDNRTSLSEPVAWIKQDFLGRGYAILDEAHKFSFSPTITKHNSLPLYLHPLEK